MGRLVSVLCLALERVITIVTALILAALLVLNALEIVGRTYFAVSFQWIYETNLLLASWMYFLGIYLVYRRAGDIAMSGLVKRLPAHWRGAYDRLVLLVTAAMFLLLAWFSWKLVLLQLPFRTPGTGFPRAAFTAPLLIGAAAVALDALRALASSRREPARHEPGGAA